ncbi:MAG: hypothetical protein R3D30_11665 [Hyphomicrobiales bacterium]
MRHHRNFADLAQGAKFLIDDRYFTIDYNGGTDGNDVVLTSGGALIIGTDVDNIIDDIGRPGWGHVATELADVINGLGGADTIMGLGGDDFITGGTGKDSLGGGLGAGTSPDFNSTKDVEERRKPGDTIIDSTTAKATRSTLKASTPRRAEAIRVLSSSASITSTATRASCTT